MDAQNMTDKTQEWQEQAEDTARGFKEKAQEWKDKAEDWQRKASHHARKAASVTNDYVRDNPWESVGYVAAGAFIIGFLIGRMGRD
jgi:ElaB/YqjD/DUF883 family membrane-anchored ribosome-binding protein